MRVSYHNIQYQAHYRFPPRQSVGSIAGQGGWRLSSFAHLGVFNTTSCQSAQAGR